MGKMLEQLSGLIITFGLLHTVIAAAAARGAKEPKKYAASAAGYGDLEKVEPGIRAKREATGRKFSKKRLAMGADIAVGGGFTKAETTAITNKAKKEARESFAAEGGKVKTKKGKPTVAFKKYEQEQIRAAKQTEVVTRKNKELADASAKSAKAMKGIAIAGAVAAAALMKWGSYLQEQAKADAAKAAETGDEAAFEKAVKKQQTGTAIGNVGTYCV
jgi:hypothetical protein